MIYKTETIKYNLSEEEREIDKEIKDIEKKIRDIQKQYDSLFRSKPKRLESIKFKEDKLRELDKESRYYSKKRNELLEKLYRKEIA